MRGVVRVDGALASALGRRNMAGSASQVENGEVILFGLGFRGRGAQLGENAV